MVHNAKLVREVARLAQLKKNKAKMPTQQLQPQNKISTADFIFMTKAKRLPKSTRKFIRREKARIRRQFLHLKEQQKEIAELYQKLSVKHKSKQ